MPPAAVIEHLCEVIRTVRRPVVLVDGRSGSGKTTLARALARRLQAEFVRLDELYPGWDGLDAGSRHVHDELLSGPAPRWRAWNWSADAPGDWHGVDPRWPLVIEGTGSLSAANRARATFAIWVELDTATRRARALERDGELYAPHWDRWARQEEIFIARERPRERADVVLNGDTWAPLPPRTPPEER